MLSALEVYRDDGPLARLLGRAAGRLGRTGEVPLLLAGAVPLVAALVVPAHALSTGLAAAAAGWFVLLAGAGSAAPGGSRFSWTAPPLLRALEYTALVKLTVLDDPGAMPACFALLAVLAFHHYDAVYRLRHQRTAPPAWTNLAGGGWDGRLLVAAVLALAGVLGDVLGVVAVVLGLAFVAESVTSWLRFVGAERPTLYEDEDLEDA
jgi:hypothetical protein